MVQRVLDLGLAQIGEGAGDHDEENDAHGENVGTLSAVVLLLQNLGRLILPGSHLGVVNTEAVLALLVRAQTEVSHLQVVARVQQNVLRLQVPMHNARVVVQVVDGAQQLFKIVARKLLVKTAPRILDLNVRKEVTLLDKLEHYEKYLDGFAGVFDHDLAVAVVLDQLDDVGVVQLLQQRHLVQHDLLEHRQTDLLHIVSLYDFDRVEIIRVGFRRSQFHFGV